MRLALAVLVLLVVASPAAATVRHAKPGGATTGDCTTTACDFPTAVAASQGSDEVELEPGDYGSESSPLGPVTSYNPIHIHGQAGKARPRIFAQPAAPYYYGLGLFGAGATVKHLAITAVGSQVSSSALWLTGSSADDVIVHSKVSTGFAACYLQDGSVMTNSVCWTPSIQNPPSALAVATLGTASATPTVTVRNVTAVALGPGASGLTLHTGSGYALRVDAVNSVIEGIVAVAYYEDSAGNGTIDFRPTYSNLVGQGGNDFCAPAGDCTQSPSSTNLPGNALFVDLAGNYHQDPMSPTINRGTNSALNGGTDFDGQPRSIGGRTDIGADELSLPPLATTTPATSVSAQGAILTGYANPRGVKGTRAFFEFGTTKAYGFAVGDRSLAANAKNQRVTGSLGSLKPKTRYHFRLVATGPGGRTVSGDRSFVTTGPFKGLVLPASQTVEVPKATARVQATCPASASFMCRGTLTLSRKGKNGKRVSLGKADFAIPRGKTKPVPVPLNDGAVKRLDDRGSIGSRADASATGGSSGAPRKTRGKVTLERPGKAARSSR